MHVQPRRQSPRRVELAPANDRGHRQRLDDFVRGKAVSTHPVGIHVDDDTAGTAAEGRRGGNAGERREGRTDAVERLLLHFAQRAVGVVTRENEIAHRHAAGVEAHHERRDRAGRHEGAGTVHLGDRLGHRLRHIRARVELELHDRSTLDRLRLHVLDARDVEEVVLVAVGQVALHLGWIHTAVRLRHIDRGNPERREDVP